MTAARMPGSFRKLIRYAARYEVGDVIYEPGSALDRFFVVLDGKVVFQIVDANGEVSDVGQAITGEPFGHVAAFTGRPTSAAAAAAGSCVVLAIPVSDAVEAFRVSPELALRLIERFSESERQRLASRPVTDAVFDVGAAGHVSLPPATSAPERAPDLIALEPGWDEVFFFSDTTDCPICGSRFEFLRVRTSGVRPESRDSDFRIVYASEDPTRYSIVVCPHCGYAAYLDDFRKLDEDERVAISNLQAARDVLGPRRFHGARDLEAAALALDLAIQCYSARRDSERRHAVLQHRRAWVERERGRLEEEHRYLREARDAYVRAFEQDTSLTDEAAMRAAYLIGDLNVRLGDYDEAGRWLETVVFRGVTRASGRSVLRLAQERLQEARERMGPERRAS